MKLQRHHTYNCDSSSQMSQSPTNKAPSFTKLQNKILVTQIEENGDEEETSLTMVMSTFRQSLHSIIQENINYQNTHRNSQAIQTSQDGPSDTSMGCFCSSDPSKEEGCSLSQCSDCQNKKSGQTNKYMLNLESILFQEVKIYGLIQELGKRDFSIYSLQTLCEDWWEISRESSSLFDLFRIYKEPTTQ